MKNTDVQLIISETTRICQKWMIIFYFPGDFQRVDATVSVLCGNHTTLCSVSTLRLRATLSHTIRQILVALQTTLGQHQRAGMLFVNCNCDVVAYWMIVSIM